MIKIRYADLPGGLHIRAVARGRDTIIYMLPGLTTVQRQAALRRVRSSARMGHGPRLSAAGVAGAVMVDRIRTTVRNGAGAMRGHPGIFVPPILIVATAAVAYVLLVSVSIRIREPQAGGPGAVDPVPAAVAPPLGSRAQDPGGQPARPAAPGRSPGLSHKPAPRRSGGGHPTPGTSPSPSPTPSPTGTDPMPSPSPTPQVSAPSGDLGPSPGGPNSAGPGSGPAGDGRLCLDIGPLGACLSA